MVAQTQIPRKRLAELERYSRSKFADSELRCFLCLWLRSEQEMPTAEIAKAVGFHEATVRIVQRDFIDRGTDALRGGGGSRRRQLMSPGEEAAFLEGFLKAASDASLLTVGKIKSALEERLGRQVHQSTVYRMLGRNGNFLAHILRCASCRRRMPAICRDPAGYERSTVLAVTSVYGVELLPDNVEKEEKKKMGFTQQ